MPATRAGSAGSGPFLCPIAQLGGRPAGPRPETPLAPLAKRPRPLTGEAVGRLMPTPDRDAFRAIHWPPGAIVGQTRSSDPYRVRPNADRHVDVTAESSRLGTDSLELHRIQIAILDLRDPRLRDPEGGRDLGLRLADGLAQFFQVVACDVRVSWPEESPPRTSETPVQGFKVRPGRAPAGSTRSASPPGRKRSRSGRYDKGTAPPGRVLLTGDQLRVLQNRKRVPISVVTSDARPQLTAKRWAD